MDVQQLEEAKSIILEELKQEVWSQAKFFTVLSDSGSSSPQFILYSDSITQKEYDLKEIFTITRIFKKAFLAAKADEKSRFNKVEFEVYSDSTYQVSLTWDDEEVRKNKLAWSNVIPQWVNDRLISLLFSAGYGDEANWQRGVFIFTIQQDKLSFEGTIYNDQTPMIVQVKLPDYLIVGILEHYQITNEGFLKDQWQPWNQLEIRSPHNSLDLDKDITYRLITDKG